MSSYRTILYLLVVASIGALCLRGCFFFSSYLRESKVVFVDQPSHLLQHFSPLKQSGDQIEEAWAFLFHDSGPWLEAARVLVFSLNKMCTKKRDVVALVLPGYASEADMTVLRQAGVIIHRIDWVKNALIEPVLDDKGGAAWISRLRHTMAKLRAWELTQYQKVVLIDLDILPISNIEVMFSLPLLTAAPYEGWPCGQNKLPLTNAPWINLGIINLVPSNATFQSMLSTMKSLAQRIAAITDAKLHAEVHTIFAIDQGFLNYFFRKQIFLLPYSFLDPAEGGCFSITDFYQNSSDGSCVPGPHLKAIHYTGEGKPWSAKPQWGVARESFNRIPLDRFHPSDCKEYRKMHWWKRYYEMEASIPIS